MAGYRSGKISISQEKMWTNRCRYPMGRRTMHCGPRASQTFLLQRRGMEGQRKERMLLGCLILLLLGTVVVLAALLGLKAALGDACPPKKSPYVSSQYVDVAIVGGGLAGTYAAYKIRSRGLSVQLFEHSNRIGGRLYTGQFPDKSKVELGGAYYMKSQERMEKIVEELRLETEDAQEYHAGEDGKMHYVRGRHIRAHKENLQSIPYKTNYSNPQFTIGYFLYTEVERRITSMDPRSLLTWSMKSDNTSAYSNSWRHFLRSILQAEEYNAVYDLSFPFRSIFNHDISLPLPMMAIAASQTPPSQPGSHKTIKQGMQALPLELAARFHRASTRHYINLNHRLSEIKKEGENYMLRFTKTTTNGFHTEDTKKEVFIRAKRLILAVSRRALDLINWDFLKFDEKMKLYSKATHDNKAFKLFLKYDKKWWKNNKFSDIDTMLTDLPLVQTTEFTNSSVLMAAYCDDTCVSYWEPLTKGPSCSVCTPSHFNVTDRLLREAKHQLAQLYQMRVVDIPEPQAAIAQSWSEDPIGGALSLYKPGYNWTDVMHYMAQPLPSENVHIIGSSFSEGINTIWAEGALETTDNLLNNYFTDGNN